MFVSFPSSVFNLTLVSLLLPIPKLELLKDIKVVGMVRYRPPFRRTVASSGNLSIGNLSNLCFSVPKSCGVNARSTHMYPARHPSELDSFLIALLTSTINYVLIPQYLALSRSSYHPSALGSLNPANTGRAAGSV